MEQEVCKQCKKKYMINKVKIVELGYIDSYDTIATLESKLLKAIDSSSRDSAYNYCFVFDIGCKPSYYKKKIIKMYSFDGYHFDEYQKDRFKKIHKALCSLGDKYNLSIKPCRRYDDPQEYEHRTTFGIAFYLTSDDLLRIKAFLDSAKVKQYNEFVSHIQQNTLGENVIQKLQSSKIMKKVEEYLCKLYVNKSITPTFGDKDSCVHVSVYLYNSCICFGGSLYENENKIYFSDLKFKSIETDVERNTLFIALYNYVDAYFSKYTPKDKKYKIFADSKDGYLALSLTMHFDVEEKDEPQRSMFE